MSRYEKLLSPLESLGLSHRVAMAPLTRVRGTFEDFTPTDLVKEYYTQRATKGGLLITEAVPISPETPYQTSPGIFTDKQEAKWEEIVSSVHEKGGKISMQLWHTGRMCTFPWSKHPFLQSLDRPLGPVSSSSVAAGGHCRNMEYKTVQYEENPPRALRIDEMERVVNDYKEAAERAKRANFDFVEIHSAHGYLLDQFLCDSVNQRDDEFGTQSLENRTRLLGMILKTVIEVMGSSKRVGIRISPTYTDSIVYYGCRDSNPEKMYRDVVTWLDQFNLAYLLLSEPRWIGVPKQAKEDASYSLPLRHTWAKEVYSGVIIGSSSFQPETAEKAIQDGIYDAIAFGRLYISNPDLVQRIRQEAPLNDYHPGTFFTQGREGYVDYPDLDGKILNAQESQQVKVEEIGSLAQ
eukprot:CAMPEP_0201478126 /NCGR_PEP_ID=MMETSP0151_2-20130828/3042_1 /ASSEMBLY_ACC=CAM_ASM_000257 /TAXON_ID=200890 /ORGANISM="Paramoeba atlantica, Strain 621/1 / CCAP 1560/9" /LENGTH=406 /DNA_ID=CAMNT_0047859111 /DNA_START=180 /DNA_END=1400 /DNA_ORIENTATION=+